MVQLFYLYLFRFILILILILYIMGNIIHITSHEIFGLDRHVLAMADQKAPIKKITWVRPKTTHRGKGLYGFIRRM